MVSPQNVSIDTASSDAASSASNSIYLASQSPRRRELLQQIGVLHSVIAADIVEQAQEHETALDYVQRLAAEKALAGLAGVQRQGLARRPVLGADTIVVSEGRILEKPRDQEHAALMLQQLSGSTHQVMTAVALATEQGLHRRLAITDVTFRPLQAAEISAYWHTGEPQDKAGGYAIQGLGAVFVQQIRGSFSAVVGLPIEQVVELFTECGVSWWQR